MRLLNYGRSESKRISYKFSIVYNVILSSTMTNVGIGFLIESTKNLKLLVKFPSSISCITVLKLTV